MSKLHLEKTEEAKIKLPTFTGLQKKQENPRKKNLFFIDYTKAFNCMNHNKLWKILKEMGIPEKCVCRSGSNRTGHGKTDLFKIGKGV